MQELAKMFEGQIAVKNIMMSTKRTMMPWLRTSLVLIGFGFTIFKFLQYLQQQDISLTLTLEGPRRIGIVLMALGVGALIVSGIQYWETVHFISKEFALKKRWFPLISSCIVGLLGLVLLLSVIIKIHLVQT